MRLEERLNKNIIDVTVYELCGLGEGIAEIDELEILEWVYLHKNSTFDMYFHYKYNCVRCKVFNLFTRFFVPQQAIEGREFELLFSVNTKKLKNKLLKWLVKNGIIENLGNNKYLVLNNDNSVLENLISFVWNDSMQNLQCPNKQLDNFLKNQLFYKYIYNKRFLKDVMKLFETGCGNLFNISLDEKIKFINELFYNSGRGYIIRLILLKYIYNDMIDRVGCFVDEYWLERLKNTNIIERGKINNRRSKLKK